jgi:hypothetical protein
MDTLARNLPINEERRKRPAYDPRNLHPLDEEARKQDDATTDVDWDEIIASTQDDFLAGRYCFSTADYPTHDEGMAALWQWMCTLGQGEEDEAAGAVEPHASGA